MRKNANRRLVPPVAAGNHVLLLATAIFFLVMLWPSPRSLSADGQPQVQPVYLALLIGNRSYEGRNNVPELQHTSQDVVKVARALRPLVFWENIRLMLDPEPDVVTELRRLGFGSWDYPDSYSLIREMEWLERRIQDIRETKGKDVPIRIVLYISAHGEAHGLHLADGVVPGRSLVGLLDGLSADSILVVADACFSWDWMAAKATAGPQDRNASDAGEKIPDDTMSAIIQRIDRVGYVLVQSYTREELKVVRGGLLTHLFISGFLGPADLDRDGILDYAELTAWLQHYSGSRSATRTQVYLRVKVRAPREHGGAPSELVDLSRLGDTGLLFSRTSSTTDECYWIWSSERELVAEVCRPANETRQIHLPAGRYRVQQFSPPDALFGREGDIDVTEGFHVVHAEELTSWWQWWDRLKGDQGAPFAGTGIQGVPRLLTEEEGVYRERSPLLQASATWRELPGRVKWGIRIGSSVPLRPLGQSRNWETAMEDSLTQESPFGTMGAVLDYRLKRLQTGYLSIGGELELGMSPFNLVGNNDEVLVSRGRLQFRLGYEHARGHWSPRLATVVGGYSALPAGSGLRGGWDCEGTEEGESCHRLPSGVSGGLEWSLAWQIRQAAWLEAGLRPEIIVELHDHAGATVLAPFLGLSGYLGVRWP